MSQTSRMISRAVPLAVLVVAALAVTTGATGAKPALAEDVIPKGPVVPALPPLPELPVPLAPLPELPADPGSVTHQPSPAGPGSAGIPAPDAATDVCASVTDPAAGAGAPFAAQCPVRETDEGGADVPLCADIAAVASCAESEPEPATTPTTSVPAATNGPAAAPVATTPTARAVARTTPATVAVAATNTSIPERESTLPFTGVAAAVVLATIGAGSLGMGGLLQRMARR